MSVKLEPEGEGARPPVFKLIEVRKATDLVEQVLSNLYTSLFAE